MAEVFYFYVALVFISGACIVIFRVTGWFFK